MTVKADRCCTGCRFENSFFPHTQRHRAARQHPGSSKPAVIASGLKEWGVCRMVKERYNKRQENSSYYLLNRQRQAAV